jgi:hypothetical protein
MCSYDPNSIISPVKVVVIHSGSTRFSKVCFAVNVNEKNELAKACPPSLVMKPLRLSSGRFFKFLTSDFSF